MGRNVCIDVAGPWGDGEYHDVVAGTSVFPWMNVYNCGTESCYIWDGIYKDHDPLISAESAEIVPAGGHVPELYISSSFIMPSAGKVVQLDFKSMYKGNAHWSYGEDRLVYLRSVSPLTESGFFKDIGDYFISLSNYPLIGSTFEFIGNLFLTADEWFILITNSLGSILDWTGISSLIESTYSIVTHSWSDVTDLVASILPTWLPASLEDFETLVKEYVVIPDWLPTSLEDFLASITDTWGSVTDSASDLVDWISVALEEKFNILGHDWQDVLDEIEAAKTKFPVTSLSDSIIIQNAFSLSDAFASRTEGFKIVGWTKPPYTCFICGKTFDTDEDFITHMTAHLTAYDEAGE